MNVIDYAHEMSKDQIVGEKQLDQVYVDSSSM